MLQPQSDDEIKPVVEALRRLDPLLDVIWNPKARILAPGHYTSLGQRTDPTYEGLFQVVRYNTPGLHDRNYVVLANVTKPTRFGKRNVLMMERDSGYAPVGEWLVEYMQTWDAAQRHLADSLQSVDEENEKRQSAAAEIDGGGAHQEALEKVYHKAAGSYWMGGAQGKAHPVTEATLFGKGKKTSTAGAPS